jgi:hypothetical protein
MNGWETDAYLSVLKFKEGADKTNIHNIKELFVGHGSYMRRNGKVLMHALSKYTALIEGFNTNPNVVFEGQKHVNMKIYSQNKKTIKINNQTKKGIYDSRHQLLNIRL